LFLKTFQELTMSANRTPLTFKLMFLFCDYGSVAIVAISLWCYAFQLKDSRGYAMDGLTTTICVIAGIFLCFMNQINKKECIRMHSKEI
jgi:hypothetical protein